MDWEFTNFSCDFPSMCCTNNGLSSASESFLSVLQRAPAFGRLAPLLPTVCHHPTTRPSPVPGSQRNLPSFPFSLFFFFFLQFSLLTADTGMNDARLRSTTHADLKTIHAKSTSGSRPRGKKAFSSGLQGSKEAAYLGK